MSDLYPLTAPVVKADGADLTQTSVQLAFNTLAGSVRTFLNQIGTGGTFINPTITGGTIDNTIIGGLVPAAGTFTTLSASSLVLTSALSVANGGTGRATLTAHGVLLGEGTAAINQTAVGTTGQMLLGVTGADPAFGNNPTITGGTVDGTPVGATTPSTGSFTTLAASGAVSGAGFTNLFASPPPVGSTAPNTGAFTTLTATTPVGVASGGTGRATLTAHGVLLGEGTAAVNQTTAGTAGQTLVSGGAGADPSFGVASVNGGGTGLATLTAHAVLLGEGTSNVAFAAPSTAGQALISAGAAADPVFGFPTGALINIQVFSTAGAITYTKTAGANNIRLRMIGGGGQGGGAASTAAGQIAPAGGGGAGAYLEAYIAAANSTAGTVGAGGSGGAAGAAGNNGGSTSITISGTTYTAPGGSGGGLATAQSAPFLFLGAAGGTVATNGNIINSVGAPGGMGVGMSTADIAGGTGGASVLGGGPLGPTATGGGNAATPPGTGGSGAVSVNGGAAQAGGNGAAGRIIIEEYA